jgi:hypothetical protein
VRARCMHVASTDSNCANGSEELRHASTAVSTPESITSCNGGVRSAHVICLMPLNPATRSGAGSELDGEPTWPMNRSNVAASNRSDGGPPSTFSPVAAVGGRELNGAPAPAAARSSGSGRELELWELELLEPELAADMVAGG